MLRQEVSVVEDTQRQPHQSGDRKRAYHRRSHQRAIAEATPAHQTHPASEQ